MILTNTLTTVIDNMTEWTESVSAKSQVLTVHKIQNWPSDYSVKLYSDTFNMYF
jgi:hypothetical protein